MIEDEKSLHELADELSQPMFASEVDHLEDETPEMILMLLGTHLENYDVIPSSPALKMINVLREKLVAGGYEEETLDDLARTNLLDFRNRINTQRLKDFDTNNV